MIARITIRPTLLAALLAAVLLPGAALARDSGFLLEDGEIDGALYQIAVPRQWNGKLLLHAHGYRPADEPLSAELDEDGPYHQLAASGWMVAMTSYRRNGLIVDDAILDLHNLWDHIAEHHGQPEQTILEGFSMGGLIVTRIAEQPGERFDGAVAVGAALSMPRAAEILGNEPAIPLLFLTNQTELEGPRAYVSRAHSGDPAPALWMIRRDGHVNVNRREQRTAIEAVVRWIETGELDRAFDPTHEIARESTAEFSEGRATGTVRRITDDYGNVFSSFGVEDMEKLKIRKGEKFTVTTGAGSFRFTYGSQFSDVPRGQPIAFVTAEGEILLAINYGNAAEALEVEAGDELHLSRE